MMKLKRVKEAVPSPDGPVGAIRGGGYRSEANTKTPHVWIVPTAGGQECPPHIYGVNRNSPCSFAVESPPTQTSNCSGSTTHPFVRGLQNCNSSLPNVKWTVCFAPTAKSTRWKPFNCLTGRDALPAR